jgi:acyl-CoA synthetase (NDP forming)
MAPSTAHRIDIARLMRPRSIAIIGISPQRGSAGGAVLENLERYGYGGEIHLVSRSCGEINGRTCVASIDDLPEGVDAVLLMMPRAAIEPAIAACARREVGGVIIFAAGFAEAGGAWKAAQERIAATARAAGMAVCGPNCLGIMNYVDGIPLTFSPQQPEKPPTGPSLSIVAQSGGLSSVLRTALLAKGVPVAFAVSTGNEAVLGLEDYFEFLLEDVMTRSSPFSRSKSGSRSAFLSWRRMPGRSARRSYCCIPAAALPRARPHNLIPGRSPAITPSCAH